MAVHPDRFSTTGVVLDKTVIVVHDAESGDGACQTLIDVMVKPGDRPVDPKVPDGRKYGSSYHAVTDGNGGYVMVQGADHGPYAAPPLNKTAWHVCMPGMAAQTPEQWLDPLSRNHIRGVAKFIFDHPLRGIVLVEKLDSHDLLAGDTGYCGHFDVSNAWGQTDHTDPGGNFPWPLLAADLAALLPQPAPPPMEDDMNLILYRDRRFNNVFRVGDQAITVSQEIVDADGGKTVLGQHDESLIGYMYSSHLKAAQLVDNNGTPELTAAAAAFRAALPADLK